MATEKVPPVDDDDEDEAAPAAPKKVDPILSSPPPELPDELDYDLDMKSIPVKLKQKGVVQSYTLRELDGKERDTFLNAMSRRMRTDNTGKPTGVKNFDGLQTDLLCMCLSDDKGNKVLPAVIQAWPARVQHDLFKKAQRLSGLDEAAEDAAKNA